MPNSDNTLLMATIDQMKKRIKTREKLEKM